MQKGHHRMCGKPQRVNKMLGLSHNGEAKKTLHAPPPPPHFYKIGKEKEKLMVLDRNVCLPACL
jgi:hypothetical protein